MVKIKLVIADKTELLRTGLSKILEERSEIQVLCTCATGSGVIKSAHKYQPDVILMDSELSECSSIEVIQHINQKLPKINVIVLTQSEADEDLISAATTGAKAYLSKSISIRNLVKSITLVANGGAVLSPPMASKLMLLLESSKETKVADKLSNLLSEREQEVIQLVSQGLTNKEIAETLIISDNTVKVHVRNIMEKLHAHTRQQAVVLSKTEEHSD